MVFFCSLTQLCLSNHIWYIPPNLTHLKNSRLVVQSPSISGYGDLELDFFYPFLLWLSRYISIALLQEEEEGR
jgi:hypothetical protein